MYEFESLHVLFLAFGNFIFFVYHNFIVYFIILSLVETMLVALLHAIAGHGLRFDWCFRAGTWIPYDFRNVRDQAKLGDRIGRRIIKDD